MITSRSKCRPANRSFTTLTLLTFRPIHPNHQCTSLSLVICTRAAKKTNTEDEGKWHARLLTALVANQNTGSSLGAYNYALLQRELRNETAANAGFREALLMPDRQMAYHLARLALADGGN